MTENLAHPYNRRVLTINDLPDDGLLAIFYFCVFRCPCLHCFKLTIGGVKEVSLVHVCQRWRYLVFGSARHLNLQLLWEPRMKASKSLDVWPPLPLIFRGFVFEPVQSLDSVIADLEHSDRISQLDISGPETPEAKKIDKLLTTIQVPFPELVSLYLQLPAPAEPFESTLPDSFLVGSAPRLRYLSLHAVPFPGLPNLLLSSTHLVHLFLHSIRPSGYISPEAMVTCLSVLTSLEKLSLYFESPQYFPDQERRCALPSARPVLPALTVLCFKGVKKYSEDLASRIDAPRLYCLSIWIFDDIDFDTPELNQLISRTPRLGVYYNARVIFYNDDASVELRSQPEQSDDPGMVKFKILCKVQARQLSFLARICTSLRPLLTMDDLSIDVDQPMEYFSKADLKETDWLTILHSFTAVKNLYLTWRTHIPHPHTLQDIIGGRTTEVFPGLEYVLLFGLCYGPSEDYQKSIGEFISARQLIERPVAVFVWYGNRELAWDVF